MLYDIGGCLWMLASLVDSQENKHKYNNEENKIAKKENSLNKQNRNKTSLLSII